MKLDKKPLALVAASEGNLLDDLKEKDFASRYLPLLQVIAQVCDMAANGEDIFLTIGATRKRDSLVLTITYQGDKTYAPGITLQEVCTVAESLL